MYLYNYICTFPFSIEIIQKYNTLKFIFKHYNFENENLGSTSLIVRSKMSFIFLYVKYNYNFSFSFDFAGELCGDSFREIHAVSLLFI